MDAQAVVEAVVARVGAAPDASTTEPAGLLSKATGTPNGIRSSPPPTLEQDPNTKTARLNSVAENIGEKSDSEAETIVLPGKDGHSPSKVRKSIKHEDRSEDEEMQDDPGAMNQPVITGGGHVDGNREHPSQTTATSLGKRKRTKHGISANNSVHLGNSSGLSSVPTSPVPTTRPSFPKLAASDSEISKSPSPRSRSRSTVRDKAKSVDRVLPRNTQYASGSGDEDENETELRNFERPRNSSAEFKPNRSKTSSDINPRKRSRSVSPQPRSHKRSISTQLPNKSSHALSHKKKRVPTPLQPTEYLSDESSASANSHPRSSRSRLRSLAAPTTGETAVSPAKMPPHRKHVNSSGQTLLAIACGRNKVDVVRQRFEERPQDLNFPDNASNTPLHTASLMGYQDVVKFLLETGNCELDCVNTERDTPLHDAVDNGHVQVVKLLLDAGANPSKPNLAGNEPLDLIDDELEAEDGEDPSAEKRRLESNRKSNEMRQAIIAAKMKYAGNRHGSDEHQMPENGENGDGPASLPKGSPRHTPPANEYEETGPANRKSRTARSMMKTKDRNLWTGYGMPELQLAASECDLEAIHRILSVIENVDDARTLYNAARGGHDTAVNLLFALGNFSPDPLPLEGVVLDQSTPILTAIGKDNHLEVIKLFLGRSDFDPTRRIKGETYYEIAKRRAGSNWQEEEQVLREAYMSYKKNQKNSPEKTRSPGMRRDGRDTERDSRKLARLEDQQTPQSHKRGTSSPKMRESDPSKGQHRSTPSLAQSKDGQNLARRGPGRPRKDENATPGTISDRETSPFDPSKHKSSQSRKSESDAAAASENEPAAKPRRKLVSGKELRGERELEKQRRASIVSNASTTSIKDKRDRIPSDSKQNITPGKSSPNLARISKGSGSAHPDRDQMSSDKDVARSLKRDDSKDRLSAIRGDSPVKRLRTSETPPRSGMQEMTYTQDGPHHKRRKLEGDSTSGPKADSSSPDDRTIISKSSSSRENSGTKVNPDGKLKTSRPLKSSEGSSSSKDANPEKSSIRLTKIGLPTSASAAEQNSRISKPFIERPSKETKGENTASVKLEGEETLRLDQNRREKKILEAEANRQRAMEEEKRLEGENQARMAKELAEAEEAERRKEEERRRAEEEKRREEDRLKEEARLREEARVQEEERREKEETDRKERQRVEEVEKNRAAEQKALYLEQERKRKEDADRRYAAQMEQKRVEQARVEREKKEERLAKLPLLLRWFDQMFDSPDGHKFTEIVEKFRKIVGYRYDTINPNAAGQAVGREQWMLNTHAAILLGEQDLKLSRFSAWDRIYLSQNQKRAIWSTHNSQFLLYDPWSSLRKALPSIRGSKDELIQKNRSLFLDLDLFFVKVSEFMFIVPTISHLRDVELKVEYRELQEPQDLATVGQTHNLERWRSDPDTVPGQNTKPEPKFYVNGEMVRQGGPTTRILKHPPPLDRTLRRDGISRVLETDPDYEDRFRKRRLSICRPLISSSNSPLLSDAPHSEHTNAITPPRSDQARSINSGSPARSSETHLPNGLSNGIVNGGSPPPTTLG
ncbi:ankyrin repeat protein [Diplocarpon rosae]|nr:ankyrin repeat protein [Diplocarpon rosae]